MNAILDSDDIYTFTDYGARAAAACADRKFMGDQGFSSDEKDALRRLQRDKFVGVAKGRSQAFESLVAKEIVTTESGRGQAADALKHRLTRRYLTSPVRFAELVMLEYTTHCNLNCRSCFKGRLPRITEARTDDQLHAIDAAKQMGVIRFLFNGGEVTLMGQDWLDLVRWIAGTGHVAAVITNGWWGLDEPFDVKGHRFTDAPDFAGAMREAGVREMMFSLDGPREVHDAYRRCPGLYDRVVRACEAAKGVGIRCGVSIVLHDGLENDDRFFSV